MSLKEKQLYQTDYEKFLSDYKAGALNAEQVGEAITHFVQHYVTFNMFYAAAEVSSNSKRAEIEGRVDDGGKAISSAKAKVLADASLEAEDLVYAEVHIANLEQIINGLKSLQKALSHEFSHMS